MADDLIKIIKEREDNIELLERTISELQSGYSQALLWLALAAGGDDGFEEKDAQSFKQLEDILADSKKIERDRAF